MKAFDIMQRFKDEVLNIGSESTLPCNLSDEWLDYLLKQSEEVLEGYDDARMTEFLAAILHILFAKNGYHEVSFTESEIFEYIEKYTIELAIEDVSRRTEIKGSPATIKSIFTDRNVELTNEVFC